MLLEALDVYIPSDRRQALARGELLPDRTNGSALFADISGFTPLTEALARTLGPRRGAEELTRQLNRVYDALVDEVDRFAGSVISFSGDAITCWFDAAIADPARRAVACALAIQAAMQTLAAVPLPDGASITLAVKMAIASGSTRRFVVGDPRIQLLDVLAGATLERMAAAEHLARKGEVLVDANTASQLGEAMPVAEWRGDEDTGDRFGCLDRRGAAVAMAPPLAASGVPLDETQARVWLLPAIYERLREGLGEMLTELRPATALFLRFEGLDYEHDEAAGAKLDVFIRWVQSVLARYEGSLLQLTVGDKGSYFYAAFGAPLAHEDDAQRAVSAALALMHDRPADINFVPSLQIGISQGTMRTGAYGGMTRRTYGALGDDVNMAARLMQAAAPWEILASQPVEKAAGKAFAWEALPPLRLKGKSQPVAAARLLGRRQGQVEAASYSGALVGREAEIAELVNLLQPIFAGRFAGLIYVYGEPGMGKSRLVHEARQRVGQASPVSWFTCQAEGILRQSLNAFQYFLRQYFDQRTDRSEEENKARFEAILGSLSDSLPATRPAGNAEAQRLAQELERTRSFLGALAGGLRWPGSLYEQLEPRLRFENMLTAFKTLIQAESLRQPVILLVEDAYWLDADSGVLLNSLTRNIGQYPVAVVLTSRYRDDGSRYVIEVDSDVPQAAIDLNQLSPAGAQAMAAQILESELDDEVAAFLASKTSGNPFFVEQLALDLRERRLLARTIVAGRAVVTFADPARIGEVPHSITAVLVARLDRLIAQVRAVVQTAAVLGHEFEVGVLSEMLRGDEQLPAKVRQAETDAIWVALSETRYLFKHALLRDAAYDMQLQARLHELHGLAGAAIERLYAADLAAQAAVLAYHWGQAREVAKETQYAALAGQVALRRSAFRDGLRFFQRVLALLPSDAGGDGEATATAVQYWLGEAYAGLGALREAQAHFGLSLGLARARKDSKWMSDALCMLGGLALRLGEADQAQANLQEGLAWARRIADDPGIANALLRLGHIASARGEYPQAIRFYEESLALARAMGDEMKLATILNGLGIVELMLKRLEPARRHFEEAQTVFRAIGYRTGVILTLGNLGTVELRLSQPAAAQRLYDEALALSLEIGDRRLRGALLDNLGDVAYLLGNDVLAAQHFSESLKLMVEIGAIPSALLALAGMARLLARADEKERALGLLSLAVTHPAADDEVRQRAEPVLAELKAALPPEVVAAALADSRAMTLEAETANILGTNLVQGAPAG